MNEIKKDIDNLFDELKKSNTYTEYEAVVNKMRNNKEIMNLIKEVKRLQKILVNNKDKVVEKELEELYKKLDSYPIYQTYLINKDLLEEELNETKDMFEAYFNELLKIK